MMKRNEIFFPGIFRFESGETLDGISMVFYTSNRERRPDDKVIWICHALTGNSNPEDWWGDMVGEGKLFDPEKYFIVCGSMITSAYGACSPATLKPDGKPYLLDFPKTTVRDIVNALILVRKYLGIESVDLMLGPSIGGFQTYEWLVMEPDLVKKAVLLATDYRITPYMTAFNESQRMALRADPTFLEAKSIEGGREGLKCARSIALISYRSQDGYNTTQYEKDDDVIFADRAASYQRHQGEKLVAREFDAYSYWYLTYALDSMNIGRGRGGCEKALSMIKADCMVFNISSDNAFPAEQGKHAASLIPKGKFRAIDSIFGHDGFLVEHDQMEAVLKEVL